MRMIAFKNHWIKACTGIELNVRPDNSFSCRYCSASLKAKLLTIDEKGEESGDLKTILGKIPTDKPFSLTISGKGVLIKKVPALEVHNMSSVFPNFKSEDFYEQSFISGDARYIAIIRKETADKILAAFSEEKHAVLNVSLGPFAVSHVVSQLNLYSDHVQFDGHMITIKDDSWIGYQYQDDALAEFQVKIDIEVISERLILAYAAAFQLCLSHLLEPVKAFINEISSGYEEFIEKKKFQFRAVSLLGMLFVLLFFNFLMFNHFNKQNQGLLTQVNESTASIRSSKSDIQDLKAKEKLIKDLGWNNGIKLSFVLDQIGQTVPSGIRLTLIKAGFQTNFADEIIIIQGSSKELRLVNDWMYRLQAKEWLEKVTLDNFRPDDTSEEQIFNLTLKY